MGIVGIGIEVDNRIWMGIGNRYGDGGGDNSDRYRDNA